MRRRPFPSSVLYILEHDFDPIPYTIRLATRKSTPYAVGCDSEMSIFIAHPEMKQFKGEYTLPSNGYHRFHYANWGNIRALSAFSFISFSIDLSDLKRHHSLASIWLYHRNEEGYRDV